MKKTIALILAATMLLAACGAEDKVIGERKYFTYGLFTQEDRDPCIHYEVSGWSIFWSVVFIETVVAPIYFLGWNLFQPEEANPNGRGCVAAKPTN